MDLKKANEDSNMDRIIDSIDVAILDSCVYLGDKAVEFSLGKIEFSDFLNCSEHLYQLLSIRVSLRK